MEKKMKTQINWHGTPIIVEHVGDELIDVRDLQGNFVSIDSNKHTKVMNEVRKYE